MQKLNAWKKLKLFNKFSDPLDPLSSQFTFKVRDYQSAKVQKLSTYLEEVQGPFHQQLLHFPIEQTEKILCKCYRTRSIW